ncbi:MAG: hypothetical protein IT521_10920 [Burkholderiales bacterium]|nr:hypothetical protein [Burkholderiales bacterium]
MKVQRLAVAACLSMVAWSGFAWSAAPKVYVANEDGNTITVLDAATFSNLATISAGQGPHNVQVSPDRQEDGGYGEL